MLYMFNGFSSLLSSLYSNLICVFSYYYLSILSIVLVLFVSYRFPYCYSPFFFSIFLLIVVFNSFIALFLRRIVIQANEFFSSFLPIGTPLYICPLVCLAETVSFIIRPFVLIFRPFINISLGCLGAVALGNFCLASSIWIVMLMLVFFYEVFVALVHWFIVTSILSFSIDH